MIQLVVSTRRTLIISFSLSASANICFGSASSAEEDPNTGEAQETIELLVLTSLAGAQVSQFPLPLLPRFQWGYST